ncbi:MAG: RnfABCDGE type electron transport complex subunit D [Bacteroidales bacterium]
MNNTVNKIFTVSPSPHIHSGNTTSSLMYGVLIALLPAFAMALYVFGLDALIVTATAVVSCMFFEWVIQRYVIHGKVTIFDGSAAVTGVLLAFNVPGTIPLWMIIIGSFVAIGIGKMSFGGLGQNPFNPALVGRVFLLMSFPVQMTQWPEPVTGDFFADAVTGATPLAILKEGLSQDLSVSEISADLPHMFQLVFGNIGGSLGEVSAIALILGGIYMLYKKIISWHIPVSVLVTMFVCSGILYMVNSQEYIHPMFHVFTGGALLGAIFMATDMASSPMTSAGMIIYGIGIGIITIAIRVFGAYPEGISFAILIMNACVPIINKNIRPRLFGVQK